MSSALSTRQKVVRRELKRKYLMPCKGYWSSIQRDQAPPGVITGDSTSDSYNCVVDGTEGQLVRRKGIAYYNESDPTAQVGLLEAVSKNRSMNAMCRQLLDVQYPSTLPGQITASPTALYTDATDLAHMGQLYVPTSTQGTRKVLGHEMGTLASPGTTHYPRSASGGPRFKMIALPYLCGGSAASSGGATQATGYSRCAFPLARALVNGGAMRAVQASGLTLVPDLHATPLKHNGKSNPATNSGTETVRIGPWGHLPPLWNPDVVAGAASTGTSDRVWWDGDAFYVSVVFQMDDGSFSAPSQVRSKNAILTAGLGLVVVGSASGTSAYQATTMTNIPIGPTGTKARVLCRTRKTNISSASAATRPTGMPSQGALSDIDSSGQKLYVLGVIQNNTQITYTDTGSNDDTSLRDDPVAIRTDGMWPRPSRYAFEMERRVGVGCSRKAHPCAIVLAPNANGSKHGLNGPDDTANAVNSLGGDAPYSTNGWAFRLYRDTSGVLTLQLRVTPCGGSPIVTTSIALGSGAVLTVQDVIDSINASAALWSAQPVPGTDPNIVVSKLAPTVFDVASCTVTSGGSSLTVSGSAFADVAIGMRVKIQSGTGTINSSAIVGAKATDGSITMVDENGNTITASVSGTATLRFWSELGDDSLSSDASTWDVGNYRCFLATHPGIIGLLGSYVDSFGIDTRGLMFTTAAPGSSSLAPQSFYNAEGLRHSLPASAGIFMGSATAYPNQVVCGSDGIYVLKNVKGANTGEDADYHLFPLSPRGRGCIQYGTIVAGDGWCGYLTREGFVVTDSEREIVISNALFNPSSGRGIMADICQNQSSTNGIADLPGYQRAHALVADGKIRLTINRSDGLTGAALATLINTAFTGASATFAKCGYSFDIVTGENDSLRINASGQGTVTVPAGHYTGASLAATVQGLLNASATWTGKTFTVTYSMATLKFTIAVSSGTMDVIRTISSQTLAGAMGYQLGTTPAAGASVVSDYQRALNKFWITGGVAIVINWSSPLCTMTSLLGHLPVDSTSPDTLSDNEVIAPFPLLATNNTIIYNYNSSAKVSAVTVSPDTVMTFVYDFSKGIEASGLAEVTNQGEPYPWSAPQLMRTGAMVRAWDGRLWAANDDNGGSTGNGTIWQLETGLFDVPRVAVGAVSAATTIVGSLVAATGVITAQTAGDFRKVPVGALLTGVGITGSATVTTKDVSGNTVTVAGILTNQTAQSYTCYGQEIEAFAYLCTDHLEEVGNLTSGQFANVVYACPTGELMGLVHSYDFARATQATVTTSTTMPATGAANATTHRAPPDNPLIDLPSLNRSPGTVQEWGVFWRNGSMGTDTQSRGEFWGLEATYRRLNAYV